MSNEETKISEKEIEVSRNVSMVLKKADES